MKHLLLKFAFWVSSPKLTALLLLYAVILLFLATSEIPASGIATVQSRYFEAWFALWGGWLPLLGGKGVGILALGNLFASAFRFGRSGARGLGFAMVHVALALLIISGFLQGLWRWEGILVLHEGVPTNKVIQTSKDGKIENSETMHFSAELVKFTQTSWQNTDVPSQYSSTVKFHYKEITQEKLIKMNEPASFGPWTFYQSSFADGGRTSVLQAVRNPAGLLPWVSIILVFAGMVFTYAYRFLKGK